MFYTLRDLAADYIQEQFNRDASIAEDESAQKFVHAALDRQITRLQARPDAAAALFALGASQRFQLPIERQMIYARALAPQIAENGRWYDWAAITQELLLHALDEHTTWLETQHGVAQRWLGNLPIARDYLRRAMHTLPPDSTERADLLVELAVVNRYRGRWKQAHDDLKQALAIFESDNDAARAERCIQELCQLMLDGNQPDEALRWLTRLSPSARTWGLTSQINLQMENYRDALHAAEQALRLLPVMHANRGRALATLGQIHAHLGHFDEAVEYLSLAAELLEQSRDLVGLARAHTNLAAAYLRQPLADRGFTPNQIFDLLRHAWTIQTNMGDKIGLEITRQNFTWLETDSGLHPPY